MLTVAVIMLTYIVNLGSSIMMKTEVAFMTHDSTTLCILRVNIKVPIINISDTKAWKYNVIVLQNTSFKAYLMLRSNHSELSYRI